MTDAATYIRNRNAFPAERLVPFVGKYIAWSEDGTDIIASADTVVDLIAAVDAKYPVGYDFAIAFVSPAPVAEFDPRNPAGTPLDQPQ
ncbi:MAG: DUF5678 domain-containing protein [Planctomycetia bacterium]|nr:DUF5678 domain-containing protein [Planctomycetia bacterium]